MRYRSVLAKARFLQGRLVRAVWVRLERETGTLSAPRLLLSTDPTLRPDLIVKAYARRWPVEPLFNQFRHAWGSKECWQQTRQGWAHWRQIRCAAYTLLHLRALAGGPAGHPFAALTPWRAAQPLTAGRIRVGLQRLFGPVDVRACGAAKSHQFHPPEFGGASPPAKVARQAACVLRLASRVPM